jgi:Icc protein
MRLFFAADFHIMADPLGTLRGAPVRANLEETIKYINANSSQSIDQVVVGGDLSHDGTTASYDYVRSQLKLLQCTYHLIPGNHDTNAEMRAEFEALPRSLTLSSGWMLHLVDSRLAEVQEGAISPSSLQYLQDHLGEPCQGHVIALHHDIFQPNTPVRPGIVSGVWDFLKMVGEVSATYKIVVSGHRHQYAVIALGGALFVNSGAVSCQFEFSTGQLAAASIQPEIMCIEVETERAPAVSRHVIPVSSESDS